MVNDQAIQRMCSGIMFVQNTDTGVVDLRYRISIPSDVWFRIRIADLGYLLITCSAASHTRCDAVPVLSPAQVGTYADAHIAHATAIETALRAEATAFHRKFNDICPLRVRTRIVDYILSQWLWTVKESNKSKIKSRN